MTDSPTSEEGQFNERERTLLHAFITGADPRPRVLIEVGTAYGRGSTLTTLRALKELDAGRLWGIEASPAVFQRMQTILREQVADLDDWFTPVLGLSHDVLPALLRAFPDGGRVDFVFLDGGNRPGEQITEFRLLADHMPVGSQLASHDANMRKGKWLIPYLRALDNWDVTVHDASPEGLMHARKTRSSPGLMSRARAEAILLLLRVHPMELFAAYMPAGIKRWVLSRIPRTRLKAMTEGGSNTSQHP